MSWRLPRRGAPGAFPCSPAGSVGAEPRSRGPAARVSLVAALASLLGGLSPLAAPPALLLGSLSLLAFTARPAAADVLVSNIGQTSSTNSSGTQFAQGFTTGSYSGGYILTSIELEVDIDRPGVTATPSQELPILKVELWSDSSGAPGMRIAGLTNPSEITEDGAVSFTAPANTILEANTKYHVTVHHTAEQPRTAIGFRTTDSNDEDTGAATGWSIANNGHYISALVNSLTGQTWLSGWKHKIRVNGELDPNAGVELESAAFLDSSEGHDLVIPEGGSATFGVRLLAAPAENTTVNLMKLVAQQFHGNADAVTVSPETLTFTPSNYSTLQTVTVTGVADDDADHEHVIVAAQIAGGKYLANGVYVTVSDDGGAVQVGVQPAIVREIDNQLVTEYEITFWLSRAASSQVTVDVNLGVGGTATEGADFDWTVSTVTFAPGETRKTVSFSVYDDSVEDSGETFFVELSNPQGATIAPGYNRARVEIRNDEAHLDGLMVEGAASIDGPFTALDIGGFAAETTDYAVTVPYGTTHARLTPTTADEDLTLSAGSGTELTRVRSGESGPAVALAVGENVLVVKVVAGTDVEETYRVTVTRQQSAGTTTDTTTTSSSDGPSPTGSGPDGETLLVAFGQIAQSEPEVSIERVGSSTINEGESARFRLTADPAPAAPITVAVAIGDSGEFVSSDQPNPRMVTIGGDGTADFSVATQDDDMDEPDGAITATVTAGTGYTVSDNTAEVEVTVRDDDAPVAAPPTEEKRAWHLRAGRSLSQQVVDALQQRFTTSSTTPSGLQLTVAGQDLTGDTPLQENHVLLSRLLGFETLSSQELAQGSSFSFSTDGDGARLSFWGKGAFSSFNGVEDTITLTGDVTTALVGAEWNIQRWQAGAALSHSWGNGSYQGEGDGDDGRISSTLTGIFPYGRYALTPRLGIWATAGYGWGNITLNPDGDAPEHNPATTMALGAVGMDGLLLDGGREGITLTTTADALFLKTTSEAVEGLASSEGNISRFRLGLEASRAFPLTNGASLSPSLEVGLRQDNGDAETGFGMDLGAGLSWNDPERGITATVKGRTLLSHGAEDFQDQGLALSFSWQPSPSNRGASLSLSHAVGLPAEGGLAALLNPTAIEVLDEPHSSGEMFEARLAYGFPFYNDRLTLSPAVALALSNNSRTYGLLWSLAPYDEHLVGEPWELSLEGERQENLSSPTVDHSLKLRFALPL